MDISHAIVLVAAALGAVLLALGCAFGSGYLIGKRRGQIAAMMSLAAANQRLQQATKEHWCGMKCLRQERGEFPYLTAQSRADCEPEALKGRGS